MRVRPDAVEIERHRLQPVTRDWHDGIVTSQTLLRPGTVLNEGCRRGRIVKKMKARTVGTAASTALALSALAPSERPVSLPWVRAVIKLKNYIFVSNCVAVSLPCFCPSSSRRAELFFR